MEKAWYIAWNETGTCPCVSVPADNRDLNYDKYFKEGDTKRATIEEFNSDNTYRLNLEETKEKIADLQYIKNELEGIPNLVWLEYIQTHKVVMSTAETKIM